ncbi:hypothetical protein [Segatella maculosa]|nr:hypothetical protein [Segatella maculosa]
MKKLNTHTDMGAHGSCVLLKWAAYSFAFTLGGRTGRASLHIHIGRIDV